MSLLNFLRVIEAIERLRTSQHTALPRKRRLWLETLEGRAMLAGLDGSPVADPITLEAPIQVPVLEEPPPADPLGPPAAEPPPGGDPPTDPPEDPPPTSEPPVITSLGPNRDGLWVSFSGTVADSDGPVEGLTVYFSVAGQGTVAFTATVQADGSFQSLSYVIAVGTLISAYTIDVDGNHSETVLCFA